MSPFAASLGRLIAIASAAPPAFAQAPRAAVLDGVPAVGEPTPAGRLCSLAPPAW